MPFSSTPVTVNPGDTIELRYPTPSTWDTTVTFQVQIGQGTDTVTVGTRLPDAQPDFFDFVDNSGSTNSNASLPADFTSTFQRNTTYYSQQIQISGLELRVPIRIQSSASGPKSPSFPNLASSAAFSINGGAYITQANSFVAISGTTTSGSKAITGVSSTTGMAVGMYVISSRITGEILSISGSTVTLVEPASSSGTTTGNVYFTVKSGDTVRARVTTENWYTTNSNVTITISDNYWASGYERSSTWSITTRAQDQDISTLNSTTFNDYVDVRATDFGTYKTKNISIIGIDSDVVLRATSTGDMQISSDNTNWSQSLTGLIINDTVYVRTLIGSTYTTKTTGSLTIFANGGETYTRSGSSYENNISGSWGSGSYNRQQVLGSQTDNQQLWTEVDRYPNPISLSPVFTFSDEIPRLNVTTGGSGYTLGTIYTTTNLTNPSATGLTLKATIVGGGGVLGDADIVERGSGYTENDIIQVNGGTTLAQFVVQQYRKVVVSTTNTVPNAEIDRYYYSDIPISGLGVEYPSGTYSDLESPIVSLSTNPPTAPYSTTNTSNADVQIDVQVTQGAATIRKNNSGSWVQQLYVKNGDTLNFRMLSSPNYNGVESSTIEFKGPPAGGPLGNPTNGPTSPTFPNLSDTVTLTCRPARVIPDSWRAEPIYNADPGTTVQQSIPISGLDRDTTLSIVSSSPLSNAQVSVDTISWFSTSVTVPANATVAYVRLTSGTAGSVRELTYRIGVGTTYEQDKFVVGVRKTDYTYQTLNGGFNGAFFLPQWSDSVDIVMYGAGGGNGGEDLPNSFGGIGGKGNILVGTLNLPASEWPDPFSRRVFIYSPTAGGNGESFSQGASGGSGGDGWAAGGDGGDGSSTEYSGGGGGGGGAAMIGILDTDGVTVVKVLAVAGGGGGGGGAGADTIIQTDDQTGNRGLGGGTRQTNLASASISGIDGADNTIKGGGGGGSGGGWGSAGNTNTALFDQFGGQIGSTDLDAQGGTSGQWYYDSSIFTINTTNLTPGEYGAGPGTDGQVLIAWPPQDLTPDPFSFVSQSGIEPLTQVTSNIVQITGITGSVPVSITSNGQIEAIRVCNDSSCSIVTADWTTGTTILNGQYIQVRMTTGSLYNLTYAAIVTVGTLDVNWYVQNGEPPDIIPTAFVLNSIFNAEINTLYESNQVDIGGINVPVKVTASLPAEIRIGVPAGGGAYNYGPWITSDPGAILANQADINGGDRLQVRLLSSPDYVTEVTTTVSVGSYSTTWEITTKEEPDLLPDSFTFITYVDADPLTKVFSNYVQLEGFSEPVTFTVTGGALIELNGVETGLSTFIANEFDIVRLYYTTSAVPGENVGFTIVAGEYDTTWNVINLGNFGTTPDPFTFGTVVNPTAGQATNSTLIVTVSGITDPNGVFVYGTNGVLLSINGGAYTSYTFTSPRTGVTNGTTIRAQLVSPAFPGFSKIADVIIGSGVGSYTVTTGVPEPEAKLGQWYSSLDTAIEISPGVISRFNNKTDGLPIGSMMPAFKNAVGENSTTFGELDGSPISRFPGWIYCDGQLVFQDDYPALYAVIGNKYGSGIGGTFRLPDFRNKKVVGTGPVDGNSSGSPSLTPDFGPAKTSSGRSSNNPGSHGGMWFIKKIDTASDQVITQVEEPPSGLTPTDSQFFDIGLIRTTGYENVTGTIDFITTGEAKGNVSLKELSLFEVPNHTHEMLSGVPDAPFKGRILWGGNGGRDRVQTNSFSGDASPRVNTTTVQINLWGFALTDITLRRADDTIRTSNNPDGTEEWAGTLGTWDLNSGYLGQAYNAEGGNSYSTITYIQDGLEPGSTNYNEINTFIDLATTPFPGVSSSDPIYKFVAAIDVPPTTASVRQFRPDNRRKHTHYLTKLAISGNANIFSYGNSDGGGTANSSTPATPSVEVSFNADDIGLEVLAGEFTLSKTKQLIPTPSFDPQEEVGLITPYVWVKWLIKAY